MTKNFTNVFFRGLITLIPIALTIYIVYQAVMIFENILGNILRDILPLYIPGLGLLITLSLIYVFGLTLNNLIAARTLRFFEKRLDNVPFIKAIYSPLKDLMNLFAKKDDPETKRVVLVKIAGTDNLALGLMTRENFSDVGLESITKNKVAVYFPFSYGLGGYTFLVDRSGIIEVDIPTEKAMSLAITGWVKAEKVE